MTNRNPAHLPRSESCDLRVMTSTCCQTANTYSQIGIIMLVGIASKNGVLIVRSPEPAISFGKA